MTTTFSTTDIAKTAEAAAPGRVSYDLARSRTITIASTDGKSEIRVGFSEDLDGNDCVLVIRRTLTEVHPEGQRGWVETDSDDVASLEHLREMIDALG